jgi:hypothetical protein
VNCDAKLSETYLGDALGAGSSSAYRLCQELKPRRSLLTAPGLFIRIVCVSRVPAMNEINRQRANAARCLRMAKSSQDEEEKQSWLAMAESWLTTVQLRSTAEDNSVSFESGAAL